MRFPSLCPLFLVAIALCAFALGALGAPVAEAEKIEFFEKHVRPVLVEHCYECHGPEKQKADLRVDSLAALLKGSDLGPVVVPGKPEESSLILSVRHEGDSKMPERKPKLPDEMISALEHWVSVGAPWPEGDPAPGPSAADAAKTHWAFQPVASPPVPETGKPSGEVDRFIQARLDAAGLSMSPQADRRTLVRRATFDLHGLPPTAEEVAAFEQDDSPDAFAKVIDRLLASPRYGERWGRHWLDVARYADTKGYVFQEERKLPFAYTYRDWVIRALNEDMPYDRFIRLQIAADHHVAANDPDLAAMGFLTVGRRFLNNIHDITDDRIDVVTRGFMGLTVSCARCHDHKFDPVTQKDYYAMHGIFLSSEEPKELPKIGEIEDREEAERYERELEKRRGELHGFIAARSADYSVLATVAAGVPVAFAPLDREAWKEVMLRADRDRSRELTNEIDKLNANAVSPPRAMVMVDKPQPVEPRIFIRGNPGRPGDQVERRFISVLAGEGTAPFNIGSGRRELADAIADARNPLTTRVIVNRVWQHHFGKGLVRTPGDFGVKGDAPTHPELLDWLAARFVEDGWSLKKLHRTIMLSAVYQQSSDARPEPHEKDPENRLLWRQNRQRLEFEAMRDSLLAVAGTLDEKIGGRAVDIVAAPYSKRRTVYGFIERQNLPGIFRTFDLASPDVSTPQRHVTTVPQQALFMLNHPFVIEQARSLAKASGAIEAKGFSEWQVQNFYERVYARRAHPVEVETALHFLSEEKARGSVAREMEGGWEYGYGSFSPADGPVKFTRLPHFTGEAWQGGTKLPDEKLGWVMLNRDGGHAGNDAGHAAIRRWKSATAGRIKIQGELRRPSEHGDGVEAWIVSSRKGVLWQGVAEPQRNLQASVDDVDIEAGETLDFIVSCRENHGSDSFVWKVSIEGEGIQAASAGQFEGPAPAPPEPLTPWEKFAHALLQTNEFVFVD